MPKKSQVTLFILMGLLLLGAIGTAVLVQRAPEGRIGFGKQAEFKTGTDLVKEEIQSCAHDVVGRYLKLFGMEGGALTLDVGENAIGIPVRLYYDAGRKTIPDAASLESDFSAVVENIIPACAQTKNPAFSVAELSPPEVKTTFGDSNAVVDIDYGLEITAANGEEKAAFSRFNLDYPFAFRHYLDVADRIAEKIRQDPERVDIVFLSQFDVDVAIEPRSEDYVVYTILDQYGPREEDAFILSFGALFVNGSGKNAPPVFINLEDSYNASVGQELRRDIHALDADGDTLYYSLESANPRISIDVSTGLLAYTPSAADAGIQEAEIFVDDGKGGLDRKKTAIRVTP
ncbi:TPA: hypothetical protein HA280_00060 [Candidatus Woesearchaeota archaeon]|nr:MAG: YD repeat protein [archaeon GW2011_AR11]HII63895.1 hypothetical protein [Candidatus Woesearchaeota archaeon]